MIKKLKITLAILLPLLLLSCGFKKINEKEDKLIYFQNINIVGERKIAYFLKNDILLISNKNSVNKYNAEIQVAKQKTDKIKDKTGKITRYNLSITVNLKLINLKDNKKILRSFARNEDYDVAKIHSDSISNENSTIKNITQQLSDDINNFINISMRYK